MKTRILAIILLCAVLISAFASCGRSTYDRYLDVTPDTNVPDSIGKGAFPEEFSEDEQELFRSLGELFIKQTDLSSLTESGFSDVFADPTVYYAERFLNKGNLFEGVRDELPENFTASADFRIVFPVFANSRGKQRIVAHIVVTPEKDNYSSELHIISDQDTRSILEEMTSFADLEALCAKKGIGELRSVSLVYANLLHRINGHAPLYFSNKHLILLETDCGSYVYDPLFVRNDHMISRQLENPHRNDHTAVFESATFGKAMVAEINIVIEADRENTKELISRLFS